MFCDRVVNRCVIFIGKDIVGRPCIMLIVLFRFACGGRLGYSCIISIIDLKKFIGNLFGGLAVQT